MKTIYLNIYKTQFDINEDQYEQIKNQIIKETEWIVVDGPLIKGDNFIIKKENILYIR